MRICARVSSLATRLVILAALAFVTQTGASAQCLLTNPDFETGTLAGWTAYNRTNNSANWFNYTGTVTPLSLHTISAPPQGARGLVTDQTGPATQVIYQDVTIPAGQSATLSFYLYYNNTYSAFVSVNTLDYVNNQQFRLDMMKTGTAEESVAASDVLLKLYQSQPADPLTKTPALQTFDITGLSGMTVRLRLAEAVGLSYLLVGFDNFCISTTRTTLTRSTSTGSNVQTNFGDANLFFSSVTTAGTTSLQQLDPAAQTGTVPPGDTIVGPAFNISTTAAHSNPTSVCFTLPDVTDSTTFQRRRILHQVSGNWVELPTTASFLTHQLCASTSSLSPFAVASGPTPTAADGNISGTITDDGGRVIEGAAVRLSGTQNRLAVTDAQGIYHFDNVETNGFYTVTPSRANFSFSPSQRSFSQLGLHTDAAFNANDTGSRLNPLDTTEYFVRQQYVDFLNREPDEAGLNFWVNNIESCSTDERCREIKRIDTSAAFFLSIEFQRTGYFVYRTYRAAFGTLPNAPVPITLAEFTPDTQAIGKGVLVNQTGWQQQLEDNQQAYLKQFVEQPRFASAFPTSITPAQFVDQLFANAAVSPAAADREAAIGEFGPATNTNDIAARARALRRVADDRTLAADEFNRAFVLMQYFGYLHRNPNDALDDDYSGYNFWLTKLNHFNGNYIDAEMVKAFITSIEYRQRFGAN